MYPVFRSASVSIQQQQQQRRGGRERKKRNLGSHFIQRTYIPYDRRFSAGHCCRRAAPPTIRGLEGSRWLRASTPTSSRSVYCDVPHHGNGWETLLGGEHEKLGDMTSLLLGSLCALTLFSGCGEEQTGETWPLSAWFWCFKVQF